MHSLPKSHKLELKVNIKTDTCSDEVSSTNTRAIYIVLYSPTLALLHFYTTRQVMSSVDITQVLCSSRYLCHIKPVILDTEIGKTATTTTIPCHLYIFSSSSPSFPFLLPTFLSIFTIFQTILYYTILYITTIMREIAVKLSFEGGLSKCGGVGLYLLILLSGRGLMVRLVALYLMASIDIADRSPRHSQIQRCLVLLDSSQTVDDGKTSSSVWWFLLA